MSFQENQNYADMALLSMPDHSDITPSLKYSVGTIVLKGLMRGYPDGTFRPKGFITRAEAVIIVDRVLNANLRDPYKPDLTNHYHTSYETRGGTRVVVFDSEEFSIVWNKALSLINGTNGFSQQSGLALKYYEDQSVYQQYKYESETNFWNIFLEDPFQLSMGIGASERDYYIASNVNNGIEGSHNEAFKGFVDALFEQDANEFTEKYLAFAKDYKESNSIVTPRDYIINNRSVRIMREGRQDKIVAFISVLR